MIAINDLDFLSFHTNVYSNKSFNFFFFYNLISLSFATKKKYIFSNLLNKIGFVIVANHEEETFQLGEQIIGIIYFARFNQ